MGDRRAAYRTVLEPVMLYPDRAPDLRDRDARTKPMRTDYGSEGWEFESLSSALAD